jgi:hypothetical protein
LEPIHHWNNGKCAGDLSTTSLSGMTVSNVTHCVAPDATQPKRQLLITGP